MIESVGLFPCMQYPVSDRSQIMSAYLTKIGHYPSQFWQIPFLADIICERSLNALYKSTCFPLSLISFFRLIWYQIKWMIWQYVSVLCFISHYTSVTKILQLLDYWILFPLQLTHQKSLNSFRMVSVKPGTRRKVLFSCSCTEK